MTPRGRGLPRPRSLAVLLGLAALVVLLVPAPRSGVAPADRHIRIEARSYAYTPSTISVNPGDHVLIDLVALDVVHGLYVDGYDVQVTADPGRTARLAFVANRPGAFRLRCSVTCGPLHPFMIGKLHVGTDWWLWRAIALAILAAVAGIVTAAQRPSRTS